MKKKIPYEFTGAALNKFLRTTSACDREMIDRDLMTDDQKRSFNTGATLCWSCERALYNQCSWADRFVPVKGWMAKRCEKGDQKVSYYVYDCPLFEADTKKRPTGVERMKILRSFWKDYDEGGLAELINMLHSRDKN